VKFLVIGPTDDEKHESVSAADTARARDDSGVIFLGLRRDMEYLYNAMDMFVLASHREGFPRSAMEAAAMRLPVIATDIRGCRQVVDHSETGILFPVGNTNSLIEAVARLASDRDLRAAMGAKGASKARREFDQEQVIQTTLAVYAELVGGYPGTTLRG
jgi:glycosyltransferase involved in cell wall biosynthesis